MLSCFLLSFSSFILTHFQQISEIHRHYKFDQFGVALSFWNEVQEHKVFFHRLRAVDRSFLLLPPTRFSLHPEQHSTSYHTLWQLFTDMKAAKRVAT